MVIITLQEIIDLAIMTLVLGFIFQDMFRQRPKIENYDPLKEFGKKKIFSDNFRFAVLVIAPAIILHEMAHKFVAIGFGIDATFHASYGFLALGLILKLINFSFIFVVPGYVSFSSIAGTNLQHALIALAGPLMNGLIWGVASLMLKMNKVKKKYIPLLAITAKINMFLFIFNMIPIPPFDGGNFLFEMIKVFF